ncbi:unnamed protein product [Nesidiocoris tenuis]|uniref:Uncharacterized protein n=1 Tax=Nesidiocoris tenuis TaxID=355587 RepID=A0A6H5GNU1_9HEMI|nr:unnamed protein product [Nesidiocoris tenuis]
MFQAAVFGKTCSQSGAAASGPRPPLRRGPPYFNVAQPLIPPPPLECAPPYERRQFTRRPALRRAQHRTDPPPHQKIQRPVHGPVLRPGHDHEYHDATWDARLPSVQSEAAGE